MFFNRFAFFIKKSNQKGFSLIELSVIISIAAASTVAFLSWTQPETLTDAQNAVETRARMDRIEKAIEAFRVERDRLPCPADPQMRIGNTHILGTNGVVGTGGDTYGNDFGTEDLDETQETSGTATYGIDCPVNMGAVPVQSLGLSNDYINDAWGRRFTYAISPKICGRDAGFSLPGTLAEQAASRENGCTRNDYENNSGDIVVTDGTNPYTTAAAYVVVSHGSNGLGAFLPSGSQLTAGAGNELENSDGLEVGGTYDGKYVFVKQAKNTTFDDITSFKTKIQIERLTTRSSAKQISVAECETNSQQIKNITSSQANFMTSDITGYDHTAGIYNTGEQVGLGLMMAVQDICISYYGYQPQILRGDTWSGAQCPGNNATTVGTGGNHAAETTYSSKNNVCTCADDAWDGGCTMDWFAASGLTVRDNMVLWLDADSPETVFEDLACSDIAEYGDGVACWRDKSTIGFSATQTTAVNRPVYSLSGTMNSKDVIVFPGIAGNKLSIPDDNRLDITGDMSVLFTLNFDDFNQWTGILSKSNSNQPNPYDIYTTTSGEPANLRFFRGNGVVNGYVQSNTNIYADNDYVFSVIMQGTTITHYKSGVKNGTGTYGGPTPAGGSTALDIGGRNDNLTRMDGEMGEIIIYDTALTEANHNIVSDYLSDKWNISAIPISATLSAQPVLWLDADDEATFYQSNCTTRITSGSLGCWMDKSPSGFNAVQTTAGNQPSFIKEPTMNYRSVIKFQTDDYMEANGVAGVFSNDFSLFVVGDFAVGSASNSSIISVNDYSGPTAGDDVFRIRYSSAQTDINLSADNMQEAGTSYQVTNGFSLAEDSFIMSLVFDSSLTGTNFDFYYNSVGKTSLTYEPTNPNTADRFVIGADYDGTTVGRYLSNGFVGEIIIYDQPLDDVNRKIIETYLSDKWNVEIDN
ncbi:MAG: hypothetical protein PQ612_08045 [Rickettsiales bacterium]|nr:hypothetical protein [Pseudomonadota bacterium]MDA0966827.1 hypothetical protein [Pseudomonadota bacterium]MDG4543501.1 hypothetical protein [Rickettsiales bacterium]MDG4546105.1 hypothetical protein [Rickettsiales bacterium]MDG4547578.1 hypothetical protein [Rickettsiales bacterium]